MDFANGTYKYQLISPLSSLNIICKSKDRTNLSFDSSLLF